MPKVLARRRRNVHEQIKSDRMWGEFLDLYREYASTHAGPKHLNDERRVAARDIFPHLPPPSTRPILDVGCGQGLLVQVLLDAGYIATQGADISPEQVAIAHSRGLTTSVHCLDYRKVVGTTEWMAVIATDLVEHLSKSEAIELFDLVRSSLGRDGCFIMRSPNATSPFAGNYQYSDITHQTFLTPRSFVQLARLTGFRTAVAYPCAPVGDGVRLLLRQAVWTVSSWAMRLSLAAETGRTDHIVTQNFVGVARP